MAAASSGSSWLLMLLVLLLADRDRSADALTVTAPAHLAGEQFAAQPADFGHDHFTPAVVAPVRQPSTHLCEKLAPGALKKSIALVTRGRCTFHTKAINAKRAGAVSHKALPLCCASTVFLFKTVPFCAVQQQQVGLVVVNNVADGQLFAMTDDTDQQVRNLPSVLVDQDTGEWLRDNLAASGTLEALEIRMR
eukprot:SAG22_NODE_103_length_20175_cov_15.280833_22_plen_193_part_00